MKNEVSKPKEQGQAKNSTFPFLLPIFIDKFQPHHHHDRTRTLINYHGKAPSRPDHSNVVNVVSMDDVKNDDVNIVRLGDEDMEIMEKSKDEDEQESVFMFDCIKAYNDSIEKKRSQEVLKCKMTDKGDGDDVFIVVDKNVINAKP